jgi:hypothetical protein
VRTTYPESETKAKARAKTEKRNTNTQTNTKAKNKDKFKDKRKDKQVLGAQVVPTKNMKERWGRLWETGTRVVRA